ncbi:hypothetical protein DPMN_145893 [Dreissena polymorpha]|uniref:Uncharacterized protein n=1 Tax=Dreissena polymorpha TaxID=45954 RepID=A0A9D4J1T6_DREPO|nr:hypothetical protein DPMN_145893 [Dreissena polymorpha]
MNGNTCETYALIDDGADKSFCDERLLKKLGQPGTSRFQDYDSKLFWKFRLRLRSEPPCSVNFRK